MPSVNVNGINIDYLIEGDGPETIVMVNGLADEKESWGYQTPDFWPPATGCSLRQPGRGQVEQAGGALHHQAVRADTKALVDALGITGFHLVGDQHGRHDRPGVRDRVRVGPQSVTLSSTYAAPGPFCSRMFPMWADMAPALGVPFVMRDVTLWAFTLPFFETRERSSRSSRRRWRA